MAPTALDTLSPLPDSQIMQSGTQYLVSTRIRRTSHDCKTRVVTLLVVWT